MVSASWQNWEGRIIDRSFPLLRYLGSDEQSAVFLTHYRETQPRNATIKLVRVDLPDVELIDHWDRAAQLSHPHLVRLLRIGTCGENRIRLQYCVMEYAEEDLASVLRDRSLTAAEAREMLESVLEALAYIHGQGLAHGHLKPTNILAVDEQLKISCDGIVRTCELIGTAQRSGSVYDAPEIRNVGFSPASDIWSLGVTLVESLTQRLPTRRGPKDELILPEMTGDQFLEIARSCLQVDPLRRATVAEIASRLKKLSSAPKGRRIVSNELFRHWPYIIPVAALGLAATFVSLGVLHHRGEPQRTPSIPSKPAGVQGKAESNAAKPGTSLSVRTNAADRQVDPEPGKAPIRSGGSPSDPPVSAQVVHQVVPSVPQKARDTIHGTVRVSVRAQVDPAGHVVNTELDSPGPSHYFAELSLKAARQWQFESVEAQGRNVPSEWLLRFEFTSTATRVRSVRVSP